MERSSNAAKSFWLPGQKIDIFDANPSASNQPEHLIPRYKYFDQVYPILTEKPYKDVFPFKHESPN